METPTEQDIAFERLRKVVEAIGYGRVKEIVLKDGRPVRVVAEMEFNLEQPVGVRIRKLGEIAY